MNLIKSGIFAMNLKNHQIQSNTLQTSLRLDSNYFKHSLMDTWKQINRMNRFEKKIFNQTDILDHHKNYANISLYVNVYRIF